MANPEPKPRKMLKPLIDALDLDIGNGEPIATLRAKLAALREQADALESDCEIAEAERDDFKAKLNAGQIEITALENEIAQWQRAGQTDEERRVIRDMGADVGS